MQIKQTDTFTTIGTEGGILPADMLQRISEGTGDIPGLSASDFHLSGERLNEAVNRSWNRLTGAWNSFRKAADALPENNMGTRITRERWLMPLFHELGYGRLLSRKAAEIEGKSYAISHDWLHTPIHLTGFRIDPDRRIPGVPGAARMSSHSMVQEFLNRSEDHLWGFVSNGLILRILRDSVSLTRQAYLEFDLEAMMNGEIYADFVILWLMCHQSRVESEKPGDCWLEKWSKLARDQGTRALDQLRRGVETAITVIGRGFLSHPANQLLRESLKSGQLDKQEYYRQVLRFVYRMIFVCVAEDRGLLLDPDANSEARERYAWYSVRRLRTLADKRIGTRHSDLYHGLGLVMESLGRDTGCPELALPALGSFLFSESAVPDLKGCGIANRDLLDAVRAISLVTYENKRRPVDFRNLGSEELGSVYESLLELQPDIHTDAGTFDLNVVAGSERKTTGSYYTPPSLVKCLLDSALDPVLDEAVRQADPESAILNLKVCDPACGSGHFLVAAAHRIAKALASVRSGDEEPAPEAVRKALRDVIGRCVCGVDINPMSVELCKVNLWLEAMEPGKPLSFLDHHIQCGNSLLGVTPALLEKGIPDEAFKPIEGDDKNFCQTYKRENKKERGGQQQLFDGAGYPWERMGDLAIGLTRLNLMDDTTIQGIRKRQEEYENLVRSSGYEFGKLWADAWCAAFVWNKVKTDQLPYPITEEVFRRIERSPFKVGKWLKDEILRLAEQYQFFHWHLAFPDVFRVEDDPENEQTGWSGGFDVVLGNPPWERIKLQEKEWFAPRNPDIAKAKNAAARKRMIKKLREEDPVLYGNFLEDKRKAEGESHLVRNSERFPLCGRGDINTYSIFAETKRLILSPKGRVGCIVPSGIATDDTTKFFFQDLIERENLVSLYDFENKGIFPAVDSRYKFCLLTLTGLSRPASKGAEFAFFLHDTSEIRDEKCFGLTNEDIALINPNTRTCPIFRSRRDAELTKAVYRRVPVLIQEDSRDGNPWRVKFLRMIDMANDSRLFRTREELETDGWILYENIFEKDDEKYLPLYEAKMIHHFDHRWATYEQNGKTRELSLFDKQELFCEVQPRYWVPYWEVVKRASNVPEGLASYYVMSIRSNDDSAYKKKLTTIFAYWLAGYYLNHNNEEKGNKLLSSITSMSASNFELFKGWIGIQNLEENYPLTEKEVRLIEMLFIYDPVILAKELIEGRCPKYFLGFRDVTRAVDKRTSTFTVLPWSGIGHKIPLVLSNFPHVKTLCGFLANLNSFAFDFAARQKIGGISMGFFIVKQLPVFSPDFYSVEMLASIIPRVLELTYTAWDLQPFAQDCGYNGPPFKWDEDRRFLLRCELDAAYFHLYGINRDDADYIMETFPIVKRKDEKKHGEYRTKRVILEIYDEMAEAMQTGEPYQTRLDPPPADPGVAHPL